MSSTSALLSFSKRIQCTSKLLKSQVCSFDVQLSKAVYLKAVEQNNKEMSVHNEGGDRKCLYDESVLPSLFEDCEWDKPYLTRLRAIAVALQHTNEDKVRKNIQTAVKLLGASDTVVTRGFVNVCNFARVRAVIKEAANDRHQSLVDEHVIYSCNVFNFTSPFLPYRCELCLKIRRPLV